MSNYRPQQPGTRTNDKSIHNTKYNYNQRQTVVSGATMRTRPEDAYKNYQQKIKSLGRMDYLNPIARMQYEQKLTEMYTKHTAKTQQTIHKKLKAKNQIAQFIDEEQIEDEMFDELMDYKYGTSKSKNNNNFHFQKSSVKSQYTFCAMCDLIHNNQETKHASQCDYKQLSRSPLYYFDSLDRIQAGLSRLMSQQANQLCQLVQWIRKSENVGHQLEQIQQVVKNDAVLSAICYKLWSIIEATQK